MTKETVILKDKTNDQVKDYLMPKYVFLALEKDSKLRVSDNTYVYKNDIVAINKNKEHIHSSISGRVLGVKDMLYSDQKKRPSLVIENDFKENVRIRKSAKKFINSYDAKSILNLLEDEDYKLYEKLKNDSKVLIINGIELEELFKNKYFLLKNYPEEILETIDLICENFKKDTCILALKNIDEEIISGFMNIIGTYLNINLKLLNDVYPLGINDYLKEYLGCMDAQVLDVKEIFDIYNILKKETAIDSKLITVAGDAVNPKSTYRVKKGTLLSEVFINTTDFAINSVDVYLNGRIKGTIVDTLKYVIDDNLEGIIVTEKELKNETPCINCGLCHKYCPNGLNPKYVYDHKGKVKKEYKEGCLQCGLCNYHCPANRDLKKYMKEVI